LHVLDEILLPESNLGEACREFLVRARLLAGPRAIEVRIYGDPAGHARSHVGASDWELVKQYLAHAPDIRYSMHVPSSHPAVKDRVNAVNAMLCSTMGERRLLLDPGCTFRCARPGYFARGRRHRVLFRRRVRPFARSGKPRRRSLPAASEAVECVGNTPMRYRPAPLWGA
jgi:hypothetical protein